MVLTVFHFFALRTIYISKGNRHGFISFVSKYHSLYNETKKKSVLRDGNSEIKKEKLVRCSYCAKPFAILFTLQDSIIFVKIKKNVFEGPNFRESGREM